MSKIYISAAESRVLLAKQCGNLIGSLFIHTVCDSNYYLHPLDEAFKIIREAQLYALSFVDELSDCDDFQRKLTNVFLERAYKVDEGKAKRRPPSLFGNASSWDHAFNVMITSDKLVRFIEPQLDPLEGIFLPHQMQTGIVEVVW